jgi:hypothetical protein
MTNSAPGFFRKSIKTRCGVISDVRGAEKLILAKESNTSGAKALLILED